MFYDFHADDFHTKKLSSILSSRKVHFLTENSNFAFFIPSGGLRGYVRCSSSAHLKACM